MSGECTPFGFTTMRCSRLLPSPLHLNRFLKKLAVQKIRHSSSEPITDQPPFVQWLVTQGTEVTPLNVRELGAHFMSIAAINEGSEEDLLLEEPVGAAQEAQEEEENASATVNVSVPVVPPAMKKGFKPPVQVSAPAVAASSSSSTPSSSGKKAVKSKEGDSKKRGRSDKDPLAPKPARSSYVIYCAEARPSKFPRTQTRTLLLSHR